MSKELEALEIIKKHLPTLYPEECGFDNIDGCFEPSKECQYQLDIIETALKEYEEHKQILKDYGFTLADFREACLLLAILRGEDRNIHNIDKQLKTLEIIKKKVMPLVSLEISKGYYRVYDAEGYGYSELTKEEYELLQEELE